ncbi:MAG TPA: fructose-1,6-bisphosphatase [Methanoculleus sp.]|nr:fructose-1,6-bisphosphatase [Methanoculleus sp.]
MTTLRQYLDSTACEELLRDLIELIAYQAIPIREAFIENQSYAGTENVYGEEQAAMDTWADRHLIHVLGESGFVKAIASEEQEDVVLFPDAMGDYSVVMDPLDGSSLIQVNLAVGTIIGIYPGGNALRKGEDLAAALYLLYGPMTVLTLSVGEGVCTFALNKDGMYVLMEKDIRMPEGKLYGTGGIKNDWPQDHSEFISLCEQMGGKIRYSGSFVADFHQILKYGGIYCYPALNGKPSGKLRLVYEANPIGFLAVQAGGAITDGRRNLLEVQPEKPDHKTPIYVGSRRMIDLVRSCMKSL